MTRTRSPNYPTLPLSGALTAIGPAFKAENRNKMSRMVLAKHLGYDSLNGRALTKIGAVRAYGFIEGSGDELRVSEDAFVLLNAPEGSEERSKVLLRCALRPALFQTLRKKFPIPPSEHNLKYELQKMGYTGDAALRAAQNYLATMAIVDGIVGDYDSAEESEEDAAMEHTAAKPERRAPPPAPPAAPGVARAEFPLSEGIARIEFPAKLSRESLEDFEAWLQLLLRQAKRAEQ